MGIVVVFAAVLVAAVLISELAGRTVLSTAVLFIVAGFVVGPGVLHVVDVKPEDDFVRIVSELALFAVLFTDGMKAGVRDLLSAWRLPGRALLLGLPLTLALTALFARVVAGLPWEQAFLVGAVLAPTDPVFASALVGHEAVPRRLSHLLNVESGLNDGLALPVVVTLLAVVSEEPAHRAMLAWELILGIAIGVVVPLVVIKIERTRFFSASVEYEPLLPFAIGLLVFGLSVITHGNIFLAAFSSGITVSSLSERFKKSFERFGQLLSELLKLIAIMVFAALLSPAFFTEVPLSGYAFVVLALIAARPLALSIAFMGSQIDKREFAAAAWFGPKGFASAVYALLVVNEGVPRGDEMFHLVGLVIILSMIVHSSTDVVVAARFEGRP